MTPRFNIPRRRRYPMRPKVENYSTLTGIEYTAAAVQPWSVAEIRQIRDRVVRRFELDWPVQRYRDLRPQWEDAPRPAPLREHIEDAPMLAEMWATLLRRDSE